MGAPFEDQGAVYIFLGGPGGLSERPSQRLAAPSSLTFPWQPPQMMFGHGLSKGADIDRNEYPDLAIGAPNAEAVFVYRAYPVGKVVASIRPASTQIPLDATSLRVDVCWMLVTKRSLNHQTSNFDSFF